LKVSSAAVSSGGEAAREHFSGGFQRQDSWSRRTQQFRAIAPFLLAPCRCSPAGQGYGGSSPDVVRLAVSVASWAMEVLLEMNLIAFSVVFLDPLYKITGFYRLCYNFYFFEGLCVICASPTIIKAVCRILHTRLRSKGK
jgi:hypothetical protein